MDDAFKVNEEIRNDELLKLMRDMRRDKTPDMMLKVLQKAAASSFIVPLCVGGNGKVSFHAMSDKNKRRFIVAFTDTGSFVTSVKNEDTGGVKASFEELMDAVSDERLGLDGVIINPGGAEVIFGKDLLTKIRDQMEGS